MVSYIMTYYLTALLTALNCNDCSTTYRKTIIALKVKVLTQNYSVFPLKHYKNLLETKLRYATQGTLPFTPLSKGSYPPVLDLSFEGAYSNNLSVYPLCRVEVCLDSSVEQELSMAQQWENPSPVDLVSIVTN